mmetsp:Transcript_4279/g.12305  ORF Transcript_4279/g.12305 Transcript_4279/m.12305 type:complete len:299 (-) Transcript_4279:8482-9378(-)
MALEMRDAILRENLPKSTRSRRRRVGIEARAGRSDAKSSPTYRWLHLRSRDVILFIPSSAPATATTPSALRSLLLRLSDVILRILTRALANCFAPVAPIEFQLRSSDVIFSIRTSAPATTAVPPSFSRVPLMSSAVMLTNCSSALASLTTPSLVRELPLRLTSVKAVDFSIKRARSSPATDPKLQKLKSSTVRPLGQTPGAASRFKHMVSSRLRCCRPALHTTMPRRRRCMRSLLAASPESASTAFKPRSLDLITNVDADPWGGKHIMQKFLPRNTKYEACVNKRRSASARPRRARVV